MATIMIVDDDEDFTAAIARVLKDDGHSVHVEADTQGAWEALEKNRPDLLILDVMFPEDTSAGFEFARKLHHSSEALRTIPILMLTAINARYPLGFSFNSDDIDEEWMPVSDFLEKPVDFQALKTKTAALLARSAASADKTNAG